MIWEIIVAAICGLILLAVVHLLTAKDKNEAARRVVLCLMAVAVIAVVGAFAGVIVAGAAWLIKLMLFV